MGRSTRHRSPARAEESGATLVELLVVLGLLSVIGGVVVAGILSAFSSAQSTNQRIDALNEIENAQRRVVQDLRSATALVLTEGEDLSSDLAIEFRRDGDPQTVRYSVVDGDEDAGTPAQLIREDTGQTLVTILNNDEGTEPLFTYLDSRGRTLDCDADPNACLGAARVRVTIVRDIPNHSPVRTNTEVTIRNLRFVGG